MYPKSSFSPATLKEFQKGIVKNGNNLKHDTAPSANPCPETDTVPHAVFEHNEICVFIIKAQKQKVSHSWLLCQTTLALMLIFSSDSSAQGLAPYLIPQNDVIKAPLLLL